MNDQPAPHYLRPEALRSASAPRKSGASGIPDSAIPQAEATRAADRRIIGGMLAVVGQAVSLYEMLGLEVSR